MIAHVQSGFSYLARTVWTAYENLYPCSKVPVRLLSFLCKELSLGLGSKVSTWLGPPP